MTSLFFVELLKKKMSASKNDPAINFFF